MNFPGFLGGFYKTFSDKPDVEEAINFYLETIESGQGINRYAMYKMPGLSIFATAGGSTRVRGMRELNDSLFAVVGETIFEFDSDGVSVTSYGPINNDALPVSMALSPTSLMIVSSGTMYRITGGALSTPALSFTPIAVVSIANYFVALSDDLQQFYWSSDDGATWNSGDFQTAEAAANDLLAMIVQNETLFIYGNKVTQAFLVGPNADAPFVAQANAVIPMGIETQWTVQALGAFRYWLGKNNEGQYVVYRSSGYDFERISTHAVENAIREAAGSFGISDAEAWVHQTNGHECYRITFPAAKLTFEYDATENNWAKALFWNTTNGEYEAHRGICSISAFGKTLVGDRANPRIWIMSPDYLSDAFFQGVGARIRCLRRAPHLIEENKFVQYNRAELIAQQGVGLGGSYEDNPEFDPAVMLRYSDDGGKTWSNTLNRTLGQNGQYKHRTYWNRLGQGRDRVFEIVIDAAVEVAITGFNFDAEVLDH